MRATLRRVVPEEPRQPTVVTGDLEIDLSRKLVRRNGQRVHLTPTEYGLLEVMVANPGKLLTHRWLLQKIWGTGYAQETHYLHVYVRQLRQKLGDDTGIPRFILTEPGVGYRWAPEPSVS